MQKLIFLDIDGVLNLFGESVVNENFGLRRFVDDFDKESVKNLKQIVKNTEAGVVISAACRKLPELLSELTGFLSEQGINVLGRTGSSKDGFRGSEVEDWIEENISVPYRYAIIDDESDFYLFQRPFLFQTDPEYGITKNIAYRIEYALNYGFKDERRFMS